MITLCQVRDGVAGNHGNHEQPCRSKEEDERMIKKCPFEHFLRLYMGPVSTPASVDLNLLHLNFALNVELKK